MNPLELEEFGFSENEAKIYLTLLEYGTLSPYKLAETTGLNRSYLYDILNRMIEKGMLSSVKIQNKATFQAVTPQSLYELLLLRATEFQKKIPTLENMPRTTEESNVELHKGKEVFKTIIKDILAAMKKNSVINIVVADEKEFSKIEPLLIKQYFRQLKERNIVEHVIVKKGGTKFEETVTKYRELPQEIIGNTSTFIYADKVAEIIFGNPNYAIITKNNQLANTKRKLFEHLWGIAEK